MKKKGQRLPKKCTKDLKISRPRISIKRFALTYLILMGAFFLLIGLKPIQDIIDLIFLTKTDVSV
jgi:hypothetical protein